ncbi:MAG: IS1595 family transposase [Desulfurellaceae bacterium]|nr:IS1595 family transposase [Desulfurellaceae bacterium]
MTYFADEERCIAYLVQQRWPQGVTCPTCGSDKVHYLANQRRWKCKTKHARQQFSVKVGTVMEDSPIPLTQWLPVMWMLANCKNGISSYEVHRAFKITQKTAWFMLHRIRLAMQDDTPEKLSGQVEADETLIGGKARFMHKSRKEKTLQGGRGSAGKTIVVGLLERGRDKKKSRVQAAVVKNTDRPTLHREVRQRLETGSELHTDEHSGYVGLEDEYTHEVISHAASEYVRGHVTTNGIENFWTLLKRTIKGSYVSVEPFHLHRYLDEQAFRFNVRGGKDPDRFDHVARTLTGKRLTYQKLIGGQPTPA